ncbi:Microtubule associated protein [Pleurostoma richardsiae]|uniref:Microtubule associated protein n=1 Tax=Pleurostoma richardsiae TaxID=41990 RepID=A0AA38RDA5_9PEZI|nr:Microtubule associated protein [Pleurostoma richardsiae]
MSASMDLRTIQSSPVRSSTADGSRRPRSSGGGNGEAKKKGLGLKEMEQTMSTLHKQNFDLKLELYHRRERQTELEARVETLEVEKNQAEEMNQALLQEIEKRDKAVEEAVAMIMTLESRIEQLLREREIVRQIETNNFLYSQSESLSGSLEPGTPRMRPVKPPASDETKNLNRMPSFLSERSDNTENLRNVYLGVRGSVLSLPKTAEDAREGDLNGIASPSLSVLSESSFVSVYGQKDLPAGSSPSEVEELRPFDGTSQEKTVVKNRMSRSTSASQIVTPTRMKRSGSLGHSNAMGALSSIADVIELGTSSPLQRLEKLERTLTAMNEASRPATREQDVATPTAPRAQKPIPAAKTKQEKREALRKVLTDAPFARDLHQSHNLPPTPDTISTSTLTRYKKSNDTLSHQQGIANERSYLALSESTDRSASGEKARANTTRDQTSQPASTSAFTSRRDFSGGSYFEQRLGIPPRPRSADETTSSRRHDNDWDTDSDADFDDAASMASSFDYWMRESLKPNRANGKGGFGPGAGRVSPDLFGFPSGTRGWAANDMFGSLGGSGFMGANPSALAPTLDVLGNPLPTPQNGIFGGGPPPPPNRRSSLHARTGSTPGTPSLGPRSGPANGKLRKSPERRRGDSTSRANSSDGRPASQSQSSQAPTQQQQAPGQDQPAAKRHYPPSASQATQPRPSRLNIFRRSLGSAPAETSAPASAPPTEGSFPGHTKDAPQSMVGVPSWGRRADLVDDDRASATPPPILRNRVPGRGSVDGDEAHVAAAAAAASAAFGNKALPPMPGPANPGLGSGLDRVIGSSGSGDGGAPLGPPTPTSTAAQPSPGAGPGKKKWLGLGRMTSLRKGAP